MLDGRRNNTELCRATFFNRATNCDQSVNFYLIGVVTLKKLLGIFVMVISLGACAGMQQITAMQVSDEVNWINLELPRRINDNTTLEKVSFDQVHSILVCHYTVDTWDQDKVAAQKQSKQLFCEMMEQKYRDYLFSMVDTIEYEYKTTDGRMQYAFVADKTTCK